MTELLVSRGDTFPRTFLDNYRSHRSRASEQLYNELKASKSDELVLQSPTGIEVPTEIHHGHSDNVLDTNISPCTSPTQSDFLDKPEVMTLPTRRKVAYDRIDPEDSIRDMKHYDKYLHLSQKYEEVRNIAYYLEEKYHEVKMERDELIYANEQLSKRLEANELVLREKEDEVFLQLEKVVHLEEQCEKLRAEKEKCLQQKDQIGKEKNEAFKLLKVQAQESEANRRSLERARQEVIRQMTAISTEKEWLERENVQLKETLEAERQGMNKYLSQLANQRKRTSANVHTLEKEMNELKLVANQNAALSSQFQKAMRHLATCKRRKCSVCTYTKAAFGNFSHHQRHKLFSCFQIPFQDLRNKIKSSPSSSEETESLSEFFRPSCSTSTTSECSSVSVPFGDLAISYMDECSSMSSTTSDGTSQNLDISGNAVPVQSVRGGFGSDSGFSSDLCTDCKSTRTTPKDKFTPKATLDETDCVKLQRTKWTASFRKLISKVAKK
ncbi:hypothetical protein CBL_12009 [Carabus blaptoides fortunei]